MATPPPFMHRPTLIQPFEELDRRLAVVEYGDPNGARAFAGEAADVLYDNEVTILNFAWDALIGINYDLQRIGSWVHEVGLFYAHQHEYAYHGRTPYPPSPPIWQATALPDKPVLIDPTP